MCIRDSTYIGHHCTAARINQDTVPLRTELRNGDVVEIITSPHATPNRAWLNYVKTGRARGKIRHFLRTVQTVSYTHLDVYKRQHKAHQGGVCLLGGRPCRPDAHVGLSLIHI